MSGHDWEQRIDERLLGAADAEERARIDAHLTTCAACRAYHAAATALRREIDALPRQVAPPRDLWPAVAVRLEPRRPRASGSAAGRRRLASVVRGAIPWRPARQALAAALLIGLGAVLSRWLLPPTPAAVPKTASAATEASRHRAVFAEYRQARNDLWSLVEARRGALVPETARVVERNLAIIDAAIAELETALAEDPGNPQLEQWLLARYQREIDMLQRLASTLS